MEPADPSRKGLLRLTTLLIHLTLTSLVLLCGGDPVHRGQDNAFTDSYVSIDSGDGDGDDDDHTERLAGRSAIEPRPVHNIATGRWPYVEAPTLASSPATFTLARAPPATC